MEEIGTHDQKKLIKGKEITINKTNKTGTKRSQTTKIREQRSQSGRCRMSVDCARQDLRR